MKTEKIRMMAILVISALVIVTGALFSYKSFMSGELGGAILGIIIALIIVVFALFIFRRGNKDLKNGFPIKDERSKKVLQQASSLAFYVSLYMLLGLGFLSDYVKFRDVSQAVSVAVGLMALLFAAFWVYYNRRGE